MHPIFYCQTPPWFSSQSVWSALTRADQEEFGRVRAELHQSQNSAQKDKRLVQFPLELASVLAFIDRSPHGVEARSIAAGASFAGPFIAVNTRHLKHFIGRCKSSINGCFQLIGYPTVRVKAKARECVITALPSLQSNQNILRQWTVRYASEDIRVCFFMSFSHVGMPPIEEDDLYDEKKVRHPKGRSQFSPNSPFQQPVFPYASHPMPISGQMGMMQPVDRPLVTKQIDFDLPTLEPEMFESEEVESPDSLPFQESYSADFLADFMFGSDPQPSLLEPRLPKSVSCNVGGGFDWGDFDDLPL